VFSRLARKAKQAIQGWSIQPDAAQTRNKPFECRVILLGALNSAPAENIVTSKVNSGKKNFFSLDPNDCSNCYIGSKRLLLIRLCALGPAINCGL
jgi:hypothetical protein